MVGEVASLDEQVGHLCAEDLLYESVWSLGCVSEESEHFLVPGLQLDLFVHLEVDIRFGDSEDTVRQGVCEAHANEVDPGEGLRFCVRVST